MRRVVLEDLLVSAAFLFPALPVFEETEGSWTGSSSLLSGTSIPRPVRDLSLFHVQLALLTASCPCVGTAPNCGGRSLGATSDVAQVIDWVRCWRRGLREGLCWAADT